MLQRLKAAWRRVRTGEIAREGDGALHYTGIGILEYREGSYSKTVCSEGLVGPVNYVIWAGDMRYWDRPHDREEIPHDKAVQIIRMIEKWYESGRVTYTTDWRK